MLGQIDAFTLRLQYGHLECGYWNSASSIKFKPVKSLTFLFIFRCFIPIQVCGHYLNHRLNMIEAIRTRQSDTCTAQSADFVIVRLLIQYFVNITNIMNTL